MRCMGVTLHTCPKCGAPLTHHRFAPTAICTYCGLTVTIDPDVVSAASYLKALSISKAHPGGPDVITIAGVHYRKLKRLHVGQFATVDFAQRATVPTERVVLKVFHDSIPRAVATHEWSALRTLQHSGAAGAGTFLSRVPEAVAFGNTDTGAWALVYRWAPGYLSSLSQTREPWPHGIPPVSAVWVWRRLLEALGFVHDSGLAHGAVLPQHCIVQDGEHGLRLVGFTQSSPVESVRQDLTQSAMTLRSVTAADMPLPLKELLDDVASPSGSSWTARTLHTELGHLAKGVFGDPSFHPLFATDERS